MQPFQQRVIEEKADLDERLGKLRVFLNNEPMVPFPERMRLARQAIAMQGYSDILGERIAAFEVVENAQ